VKETFMRTASGRSATPSTIRARPALTVRDFAIGAAAAILALAIELGALPEDSALTGHERLALRLAGALVLVLGIATLLARRDRPRHARLGGRHAGQSAMEQLPVAAYVQPVGDRRPVSYVSPEMEMLLGYAGADWAADARFWAKIIHRSDRERVLAERAHAAEAGQRLVSEYRIRTRDGRTLWVRDEAVIVGGEPGGQGAQHGILIDITERRRAEEALEHQALHDGLTDLPNRTLFHDRLQQAIIQARRDGKPLALLLMDLDRFKDINDTFGHQYGDLLLRQVVAHLRYVLRESDTIARLGGDEFAIILPGDDARGATLTVEKVLHVLRQPYSADDHLLDIGASVGIALFPDHGHDSHTLLQRADVAMYAAKRRDIGYALYEAHQDPYKPSRLALVRDLRDAIEQDRLVLHYQPKAHFNAGLRHHVEALLRWHHPDQGWVAPEDFIPLAEHAGLMKSLSMWVLNSALKQCHVWLEEGIEVTVAVNISPRTLHDPALVETIEGLLDRWRVPARCLEIEITESALMIDPARAMDTLSRLHAKDVCISIDDFGTGYSSLSYLTRLPADQIKIDKSFVLDMARNHDSAFIVRSVIDLGHNLSLQVVAEGVENQETWDLLAGMGCDVAQGYHLSHPLPASEISRWLSQPQLAS
jgi:diguanylate cyclase (GGDEF)-like protein/PAS domain S-box-containing protein